MTVRSSRPVSLIPVVTAFLVLTLTLPWPDEGVAAARPRQATPRAATTTTITQVVPAPGVSTATSTQIGDPVSVSYRVTANPPGTGTPTGAVTIGDGVDQITVDVGLGTVHLVLTNPGKRILTATYNGDARFSGSTSVGVAHRVTCRTVTLGPTALPDGQTTVAYPGTTLAAAGGVAPYRFDVTEGTLPDGLSVSSGVLAGEPKAVGLFDFTVTATDAVGCSGSRPYTLRVSSGIFTYRSAEGAFGGPLESFLLLLNPNAASAAVTLAFQNEAGKQVETVIKVPARTRVTVPFAVAGTLLSRAAGSTTGLSTTVSSDAGLPLVVEEVTYVDGAQLFADGGRLPASVAASTSWYFAEGSEKPIQFASGRAGRFETYLLLANDAATPATVAVRFLPDTGLAPRTEMFSVPARTRRTIPVGLAVPSLAGRSFGMAVTSSVPITAARSQYVGPAPAFAAMHASPGVTAPALEWLFAEGSTRHGFETFFAIANPDTTPSTVTFTYHLTTGAVVHRTVAVAPGARREIRVNDVASALRSGADFWTRVEATAPVVVERIMYRADPADGRWILAHASTGAAAATTAVGFAEGVVGQALGFETFVLLANPDPRRSADVEATFMRAHGGPIVARYTIPPLGRRTVWVSGEVPGLADQAFGVILVATNGVRFVADEAVYWNDFTGGTVSTGVPLPPAVRTRSGSAPQLPRAQPVAQHVHREGGGEDEGPGEERQPRLGAHGGLGLVQHVAPAGGGGLDTHAEEAECGLEQDATTDGECHGHDDRWQRVRE